MNRIVKAALVVGALGAMISPVSAFYWGSGWQPGGSFLAFTVGNNTCSYAVSTPYTTQFKTVAANNTTFTRFFAATRCLRSSFPWDNFAHPGPTITATTTIGGPANHSLTPYCPAGSSWTNGGGVYIDDAY